MASTTLLNAVSTDGTSSGVSISGTNTLVITGADQYNRIDVLVNDQPAGTISNSPWVKTLQTGAVTLKVRARKVRSDQSITVTLESE